MADPLADTTLRDLVIRHDEQLGEVRSDVAELKLAREQDRRDGEADQRRRRAFALTVITVAISLGGLIVAIIALLGGPHP